MWTRCGTKGYMAPELLRGDKYSGKSVDLFAAGVILFVMRAGFPAFVEAHKNDISYKNIV